jgi:hypothetical protein
MTSVVSGSPPHPMTSRRGGSAILAGVATVGIAVLMAVADLPGFIAGRGFATLALAIGLTLMGVGFAFVRLDRPVVSSSALGRRGAKTLAAGLLLDGAILGLLSAGGLKGSAAAIVILPLIVAGWSTVIGLGLTILALVLAAGPGRRVGLLFVGAIVALAASNAFTNWSGETSRTIGLVLGAVAACGLLAGFVGIGLISIRESGTVDPTSGRSGF